MASVLVVDDEPTSTAVMEAMLRAEQHVSLVADTGWMALRLARDRAPDLILLDIMLPDMDGFEVARRLKADRATANIPIIMVTTLHDRESRLKALQAGAEEFLNKPVDRAELAIRVKNLLRLKEYSDFLAEHNRVLERVVAERTVQLAASYRETIVTIVRAAEYKDPDTGAHISRISYYCRTLAEALGQDREFCERIFYASPMHDVGKIGIPDQVLLKPGPFSGSEWGLMRCHAALGEKILAGSDSPYLQMGAEIAGNHHERWDGSGYPYGLHGEEIPLSARIMNLCDQYDALRSRRPYKRPIGHDATLQILFKGDGRTSPAHFDPEVLAAFGDASERFREIFDAHTRWRAGDDAGRAAPLAS